MADDQAQQPQEQAGHPVATATGVAAGIAAVRAGLPDPFWPLRLRKLTAMLRVERRIERAYARLYRTWLPQVKEAVTAGFGVFDPVGVYATRPAYDRVISELVDTELHEVYAEAFDRVAGASPDEDAADLRNVFAYLDGVKNRMSQTPDSVFTQITEKVRQGASEGWAPDELAAHIDGILSDSGTPNWPGRAMVVARTEAIGAYNAGTHAGFLAYAAQEGGQWEHSWLATHDDHTRPTHARRTGADGQRVPLGQPFIVGGFALAYPGDPAGPPQEVVQCRCSELLHRVGEELDYSDRHFRSVMR